VLSQTTDGTSISDAQVAAIQPGVSTRADVVRILGAPDHIIYSNLEHDALFERTFQFKRKRRKNTFMTFILLSGSRSETNSDNVMIFFDDKGLVEEMAFRLDMDRPEFGWPWSGERDDDGDED
jgi:outer membrane protein assembly factor BamE (lipoprotein component of BamABCDE complex)